MAQKNKHNETVGSAIERSDERINQTGEVFTPMELCREMVSEIPLEKLQDPSTTYLDNSAGSGNFVVALLEKLSEFHSRDHILEKQLFAVELMEDNHKELCERIGVPTSHPHFVNDNALTYDYSFGEPTGLEAFFE